MKLTTRFALLLCTVYVFIVWWIIKDGAVFTVIRKFEVIIVLEGRNELLVISCSKCIVLPENFMKPDGSLHFPKNHATILCYVWEWNRTSSAQCVYFCSRLKPIGNYTNHLFLPTLFMILTISIKFFPQQQIVHYSGECLPWDMNQFAVTVPVGLYVVAKSVNIRFSIIFLLEAGLTSGLLSSCFRLQFCMNVSRHSCGMH